MDPYKILNIKSDSTKEQIRKAYLQLVLENHPDRSTEPNAEQKFLDIYTAYKILIDDHTRNIYNNNDSKYEYYNEFKKYIDNEIPNFSLLLENYIEMFYGNKNKFLDDLNNMNFDNIYKNIMERMPSIFDENRNNVSFINNLDINGQVYTSIKNKYLNRYEKISVSRITKNPIILHVPLREDNVSFLNEGESMERQNGNINIKILVEPHDDFTIVAHDLYCHQSISLYEYLYGGSIKIKHIDDEYLDVSFKSFIDEVPLLIVKNKGMPYMDKETNIIKRGHLYIKLSIKNIDSIKEKIVDLCRDT